MKKILIIILAIIVVAGVYFKNQLEDDITNQIITEISKIGLESETVGYNLFSGKATLRNTSYHLEYVDGINDVEINIKADELILKGLNPLFLSTDEEVRVFEELTLNNVNATVIERNNNNNANITIKRYTMKGYEQNVSNLIKLYNSDGTYEDIIEEIFTFSLDGIGMEDYKAVITAGELLQTIEFGLYTITANGEAFDIYMEKISSNIKNYATVSIKNINLNSLYFPDTEALKQAYLMSSHNVKNNIANAFKNGDIAAYEKIYSEVKKNNNKNIYMTILNSFEDDDNAPFSSLAVNKVAIQVNPELYAASSIPSLSSISIDKININTAINDDNISVQSSIKDIFIPRDYYNFMNSKPILDISSFLGDKFDGIHISTNGDSVIKKDTRELTASETITVDNFFSSSLTVDMIDDKDNSVWESLFLINPIRIYAIPFTTGITSIPSLTKASTSYTDKGLIPYTVKFLAQANGLAPAEMIDQMDILLQEFDYFRQYSNAPISTMLHKPGVLSTTITFREPTKFDSLSVSDYDISINITEGDKTINELLSK